jgi:hypothetical protein
MAKGEIGERASGARIHLVSARARNRKVGLIKKGECKMTALYIILGIIVFVIPAVCILGDDRMWDRKE